MKGEIMLNNALTKVISHYCIFTEALQSPIHRGFRLLLSLPQLRFSPQLVEFAAITFGKDEVLPHANGPIVSSGTVQYVHLLDKHYFTRFKLNKSSVFRVPAMFPISLHLTAVH